MSSFVLTRWPLRDAEHPKVRHPILACVVIAALAVAGCGKNQAHPVPASCGEDACKLYGEATVTEIVSGDTIEAIVEDDFRTTIRILGIDAPDVGEGFLEKEECWATEATEFAIDLLTDQQVRLYEDTDLYKGSKYSELFMYVILPDGDNYSIEVAEAGAARAFVDDKGLNRDKVASMYKQIAEAEQTAVDSQKGLWGPPCNGGTEPVESLSPSTADTPSPEPGGSGDVETEGSPKVEPTKSDGGDWVYYENCTEAREAGAAPLYIGEPGYRSELDRDGDGVACDWG